ncbi:ABC transporter permease subunit [Geminocystis sp. GBBB08]|uniref:ABC transporter permease n=1 Tax=Geminocystis sp. GBBB08 TaxID=2604140 RepID=UPI0027E37ACA|nr:ABC transporter permease subunit [Geminocystis sp. GBBB08]MBL1211647.1 ABC transporter permease subunit [Geminocystis sp. GBBB08]
MKTFPTSEVLKKSLPFGLADIIVILGTLVLLALISRIGAGFLVSFKPPDIIPTVDLDPRNLPYYACRSTLRMFIALFFSLLFTLIYGYIASHSRRAERVLIPLLDILQSVPVLGFLSITVTGFIALFPGSLLGLECASIFAIFTSQVWNMTFSFYQSLRTIPRELEEAVTLYHLSGWEKFIKLEVPSAMIGLVWNGMMSFGGGWFFVAASEAISVLNQDYTLPGIGSYVTQAIVQENLSALGWAFLTIGIIIIAVDQVFWRPIIAWSDKFRMEQSQSAESPESWLLDLLTTARIPRLIGEFLTPVTDTINRFLSTITPRHNHYKSDLSESKNDLIYNFILLAIIGLLIALGLHFILTTVGITEVLKTFSLGLLTLLRVTGLLIFATLIWTPIGVAIGFNPKLARFLQPVVQFLASFPANFIFPFATLFFIKFDISINWGSILLMSLGAQWYILFNSIAGAQTIPTDLKEMANSLGLKGWQKWRKLIIPGIFSAWVTGGVTASGGAWNASIVSEIVSWGSTILTADGLGSYIAEATATGDWARITLGVGMMSLFVVGINRIFWRRLYELAVTKYHI